MKRSSHYLAIPGNDLASRTIWGSYSRIRVRIVLLDHQPFEPKTGELQFYALMDGDLYAFESMNNGLAAPMAVIDAIDWFIRYAKIAELELMTQDPRKRLPLQKIMQRSS